VAAAIIACARNALKFQPVWNTELTKMTLVDEPELMSCYRYLWNYYERNFPANRSSGTSTRGMMNEETDLKQDSVSFPSSPPSPDSPPNSSPNSSPSSHSSFASSSQELTSPTSSPMIISGEREKYIRSTYIPFKRDMGARLDRFRPYSTRKIINLDTSS